MPPRSVMGARSTRGSGCMPYILLGRFAESRHRAEADGNRTRQDCVAALLIGFEVRAGHQRRERFRVGY